MGMIRNVVSECGVMVSDRMLCRSLCSNHRGTFRLFPLRSCGFFNKRTGTLPLLLYYTVTSVILSLFSFCFILIFLSFPTSKLILCFSFSFFLQLFLPSFLSLFLLVSSFLSVSLFLHLLHVYFLVLFFLP